MRIEAGLLALSSLAALTGSEVGLVAESAADAGLVLVGGSERWEVGFSAGASITLQRGGRANRVDLSAFEDARLEYLVSVGDGGAWVGAGALSSRRPLAVRLRLASGGRVWRPLVWTASEWPVPQ
jgi:hypothetical protein